MNFEGFDLKFEGKGKSLLCSPDLIKGSSQNVKSQDLCNFHRVQSAGCKEKILEIGM